MKSCRNCGLVYPTALTECIACGAPLCEADVARSNVSLRLDETGGHTEGPEPPPPSSQESRIAVPRLHLDTASIDLGALRRGQKSLRAIRVSNVGGGELWGRVNASAPWIKVSPTDLDPKVKEQTLRVEVNPRHLTSGHHLGMISLFTSDTSSLIPVTLRLARTRWANPGLPLLAGALLLGGVLGLGFALSIIDSRRATRPSRAIAQEWTTPILPQPPGPVPSLQSPPEEQAKAVEDSTTTAEASEPKGAVPHRLPEAQPAGNAPVPGGLVRAEELPNVPAPSPVQQASPEPSPPRTGIEPEGSQTPRVGPPVGDDRPQHSIALPQPPEEARPRRAQLPSLPLSMSPSFDGRYILISLSGRLGESADAQGSIEVAVSAPESKSVVNSIRGNLPGRPCRVLLSPLDNIAEHSFAETPSPGNHWGRVTVRVRPKDSKRIVRFAIRWELMPMVPTQ